MGKLVSSRLAALAALLLVFCSANLQAVEKDDPIRWEKEIQAFEAADKTNPPPKNGVLFIGSSSIRLWKTLAADFPKRKVINRGFGGSHLNDAVYYFDRIVTPYKPKTIVIYSGGNDINFGKTPEDVFGAFTNFVAKTRKSLPKTRVLYIAIAPNPARWAQLEQIKAANTLIENFTKKIRSWHLSMCSPRCAAKTANPSPIFSRATICT